MKRRGGTNSQDFSALYQQAFTLFQQGNLVVADSLLQEILIRNPGNPYVCHLSGVIASQLGNHADAIRLIARAVKNAPHEAVFFSNYGNALLLAGRLDEAESAYRRAIKLSPDFADVYNNLGNVLKEKGENDQAIASYKKALTLDPAHAQAHYHLGIILGEQGQIDQAIVCYQQALLFNPDYPDAHYNLASLYWSQGDKTRALEGYHKALSIKPGFAAVRWAVAVAQLPVFCLSDDDQARSRADFTRELGKLGDWLSNHATNNAYLSVGSYLPFYLAYQEENNRDLLSRFGELCSQTMERWRTRQGLPLPVAARTANRVIRLGIVSAQIFNHSVWVAIVKGWFQHLDRKRFELHVFSLCPTQDEETRWARSRSASFEHGKKEVRQWAESILGKKLDAVIYPEIGMDPMTVKLASLRLAPIQIATWGHPETTGLPTIDYYLSAEDFEPSRAQENYTEQLVSLPRLGCCYRPTPVLPVEPDLNYLGIASQIPVLICPGSPFKYTPRHDRVFIEIALRLGKCQFVFFTHQINALSSRLHQRVESAFTGAGLDINDFVVFIPWQDKPAFYGLMQRADVFLDTIGFSGFNTAIQALECGLPIVARDGRFMRGRLAAGILRRMGMAELVAQSDDDYINLAVRLVQDAGYQRRIRESIEVNRNGLYEDLAPVRALENFLLKVVKSMEK